MISAETLSGSQTEVQKNKTIDGYLTGAFAKSNVLRKMEKPPRISYYCPNDYCSKLVVSLKSDFPDSIEQVETSSEISDANIQILIYPNKKAAIASGARFIRLPDDQVVKQNFGFECSTVQVSQGEIIKKVIIAIIAKDGSRDGEMCALVEALRGTGVEISSSYPDYTQKSAAKDEAAYQTLLNGFKNITALHWSTLTRPGMGRDETRQSLQAIPAEPIQ